MLTIFTLLSCEFINNNNKTLKEIQLIQYSYIWDHRTGKAD